MTVWRLPITAKGLVVLLIGLGQPKSEYAYFHSKIAGVLAEHFQVVQFDYLGCGDSDGNFEDTDFPGFVEDFRAIVDAGRQKTPAGPLIVIGRGIGMWVAATANIAADHYIFWNPVDQLPAGALPELMTMLGDSQSIDIADLPHSREPWGPFYEAVGMERSSMGGELLGKRLAQSLHELAGFDLAAWMTMQRSVLTLAGEEWNYVGRGHKNLRYPNVSSIATNPAAQDWATAEILQFLTR